MSATSPNTCRLCGRPLHPHPSRRLRSGVCSRCHDHWRCVVCNGVERRPRGSGWWCRKCKAGYGMACRVLESLVNRNAPKPSFVAAHLERYAARARAGLPLFEEAV